MIRSFSILNPPPPRLSMDEYADFVEASLRESNMARVARQKELEERVRMPFRITGDNPATEKRRGTGHDL
jgi:hypothetical protein